MTYAILGTKNKQCNKPVENESSKQNSDINNSNHKIKFSRSYNKFHEQNFLNDLARVNWNAVYNCSDVNKSAEVFDKLFLKVINKHAPLKKRRVRKNCSPWITEEVIKMMRKRDKLKQTAIKSNKDKHCWEQFRKVKNETNKLIKDKKKEFLKKGFDANKNNIKKNWETIRNVIPSKSKDSKISMIKSDNGPLTKPKDKANELNNFFANIGPQLANNIHSNNFCNYDENDTSDSDHQFVFKNVNCDYVHSQFVKLSDDKATGLDNIPAKLLKVAAPIITPVITHIINHSFTSCTFPTCWKKAKVIPIFKAGDPSEPGNYRPISILVVISKIIERAVFDQLYNYLNDNNMININQSGFRPSYSTGSALINVTEDWYNEIDKGNLIGVCMIDLKKAFDTVNHDIFLQKLKMYKIGKPCIKWFNSYLSGRTQCTAIEGTLSSFSKITCGIPQGSIIGPLAFLIYINDLPNCMSHCKVNMFADDTGMYYASNSIDDIVKCMNYDLNNGNNWLQSNKLTVNADKCEFMLIGSRQRLANIKESDNLKININGVDIKRVHECKHLGVIIDDNLTWNQQIDNIRKKCLKGMFMLKQCKSNHIPKNLLTTVYNAIVVPHLDYCNIVWANCGSTVSRKLQVIQNRAARIICGAKWDTPSIQVLSQLNWNTLATRQNNSMLTQIYKILHSLAPPYLNEIFKHVEHKYNFRQSKYNVNIPKPRTEYKKRSLAYRGAIEWNKIAGDLQSSNSLYTFKNKIKGS